jgi:hypothetical protein
MFKRTFRQMFFWSTNGWKNFVSVIRRKIKLATSDTIPITSGRSHHHFNIGPNTHPRKVQRWMKRGGGVTMTTSDLAAYAQSHIHPASLRLRSQV